MQITFHGVRGSLPSPGPDTARFGGNTPCVHVRFDGGLHLVLDAGTGIRKLGGELVGQDFPIHIALTHSHWDHIQGFPFFAPIHEPGREIHVFPPLPEADAEFGGILEQMNGHNFPVPLSALPSQVAYAGDPEPFFAPHGIRIRRKALNHPGGGFAYRIDADGASLAFVTDNELDPPDAPPTRFEEWVEFCRGVDVLVHDAQYEEADMPLKHGWGHSLISQVRQLAHDAQAAYCVLYSHDPERSDAEVEAIAQASNAWFEAQNSRTRCLCAWEGLQLQVSGEGDGVARIDVNAALP